MLAVALPGVAVAAAVVEVVVALEQAVVAHDPMVALADERAKDGGGHLAVVVRRQHVADVVEQRADDGFFVRAVALGAGGRLQRVRIAIDLVAERVAAHSRKQRHQRIRHVGSRGGVERREEGVLLRGAVGHAREGDGLHRCLAVQSFGLGLYRVNPKQKRAMLCAVSWLTSGHAMGKISVAWMVPITWRQLAGTPARNSRR